MSVGTIDRTADYVVRQAYAADRADRVLAYGRYELPAERVARTQAAHIDAIAAAQGTGDVPPSLDRKPLLSIGARSDAGVTWLQDQYANDRQANAIQAFIREQARLQAHGDAANDLGTIPGMLLLQPYRFAAGVPPIQPSQVAAAASAVPSNVNPVFSIDATRRATEDPLDAMLEKRVPVRRTNGGDT